MDTYEFSIQESDHADFRNFSHKKSSLTRIKSMLRLILAPDYWEREAYPLIRWLHALAGVALLAGFLAGVSGLMLIAGAACGAMP